jgi:ComF family protein
LPTTNGEVCGGCLRHSPAFDHTEAVYRYGHPLDCLVHALKYRGELAVAGYLAETLAGRLLGRAAVDLVIPMPLHPNRLRQRGFNQAVEIARNVAKRLDIEFAPDLVRRVRDSVPQAGQPLKARIRNMRGAFECGAGIGGQRVALLDDVMTSGASLNELAKTVKKAGASAVSAWVAARTLPGSAG